MKIVIVAANASSSFGGEAFLPLKYFQILLRRGYEVKLIAHERNRSDLEDYFKDSTESIYFINDTSIHRITWRLSNLFPSVICTIFFSPALHILNEIIQRRIIKQLIRDDKVDIIHQPIPVSPKTPSSLFGFNVPVIIGPMNGGMTYPPGYEGYERALSRNIIRIARNFAFLVNRLIPGKIKAATLIVANDRTEAALPLKNHPNIIKLVENGVDLDIWSRSVKNSLRKSHETFKLVFIGRLIPLKAVDITLKALSIARAEGAPVIFDIIGEGEDRARLLELVKSLNLSKEVRFHGFLAQKKCASILQKADALILNSLRECGGAVVLEAMSLRLPVIASDWGGPSDYLDNSCGFLVPPVPSETFASRLAKAILKLVDSPELCHRMGIAGQKKIQNEFQWEIKVDKMLAIYEEAIRR